jgi:O-antigen/teichoic acid export membrane protein
MGTGGAGGVAAKLVEILGMTLIRADAVRGATWSTLESVAGQGLSFLVFLLLARILAPADFGVVAIANVYVLVAQFFIFQGLGQAIIQFADLDDEHLDTVFWINLAVGVFFLVLTLLGAGLVQRWFQVPSLAAILRGLSPIFILAALTDVQNNLLTRRLQFRSLAIRTLSSYFAGGVTGIVMALSGAGAWSLVGQQLVLWIVNLVALWGASDWRPRVGFCPARARRLLRFGVNLLWVDLVSLLSRRSDQLFVGKVLGPAAVGSYAVGARVATLLSEVLVRSLARFTVSALSRLQTQSARLVSAVYQVMEMQSAFVAPAAVGLAIVSPEVVNLFFGPKWSASVPIMQVLLLACPFEAMSAIHQSIFVAQGRPSWCSAVTTIHAAANVILFAVAIHWGALAVAVAFTARAVLMYPVELAFLRRATVISASRIVRLLLPQALAVASMALGVYLIRRQIGVCPAAARLAISVAAGAAIYAATMALLNPRLLMVLWSLRDPAT